MKKTSQAVKESRKRTGTVPTSFAFTAEEKAEIDAWAAESRQTRKDAVLDAVRKARSQGRLSKAQIIAAIEARMKD